MKKKIRCAWVGDDALMVSYHDKEWGTPTHNDRRLFEFLVLESAQAGLSWSTVLKKRENYRKAFSQFDPKKVARFDENKVKSLLNNPGIIRNRLKIEAAINNAKLFLENQKEFGSFSKYQWSFTGGKTIRHAIKSNKDYLTTIREAEDLSKDLKKRGFRFLGPTIIYAHMQATGQVDDHMTKCFRKNKKSR